MRGQAHTLEAFGAAVILVVSLLFAMQVTAVTPLSASTSSQHIENQQQAVAEDVLRIAEEEGELESTVLHWDESANTFHGLEDEEDDHYSPEEFNTDLGERLTETFTDRGIAYNLYINHLDDEESRERQRIVYSGDPSDHAVSATRLLTLYEDDPLYDEDEEEKEGDNLNDIEGFYVENAEEESFYGVVEIEVIVWRM